MKHYFVQGKMFTLLNVRTSCHKKYMIHIQNKLAAENLDNKKFILSSQKIISDKNPS